MCSVDSSRLPRDILPAPGSLVESLQRPSLTPTLKTRRPCSLIQGPQPQHWCHLGPDDFCSGSCRGHCKMLGSVPHPTPPDSGTPPTPNCDAQQYFQTWPTVPGEAASPWLRITAVLQVLFFFVALSDRPSDLFVFFSGMQALEKGLRFVPRCIPRA